MKHIGVFVVFLGCFIALFAGSMQVAIQVKGKQKITLSVFDCHLNTTRRRSYIECQIDFDKTNCSVFNQGVCPVEKLKQARRLYISHSQAKEISPLLSPVRYYQMIVQAHNRGGYKAEKIILEDEIIVPK